MNTRSLSCDAEAEMIPARAIRARDWAARMEDLLIRLFDTLGEWRDRAASRRALAKLDARMLADIGLDTASAEAESMKQFWRG